MSFIPKNPLIMPEVESPSSTPPKGTRGIFAKQDGWYAINSDGTIQKIPFEEDEQEVIYLTHDSRIESREEGIYIVRQGQESILYDNMGASYADSAKWAGTADVASSAEMDRNFNYIDETYATKVELDALKEVVGLLYSKSLVKKVTINLPFAAWDEIGNNQYSQVVSIEDVTEFSKIDLQPTLEQLAVFYEKDITFVAENDNGIITVYCIGQMPTNDYTMQATITEVKRNE